MQHLQSWKGCVPSLSRDWTMDVIGGGLGTAVGDVMLDDHPGIDQITTTIRSHFLYKWLKQYADLILSRTQYEACAVQGLQLHMVLFA